MTTKTMKEHRKRWRARQLLAMAERSTFHRHLAYWLAGWAEWLEMLPDPRAKRDTGPTRIRHVVMAGVMLVLLLALVAGPLLRAIHPILAALGRLSLPELLGLLAASVVTANALQWARGCYILRKLRDAFADEPMIGKRPL
ncbi:hypothetical protein AB4Y45_35080 [Paraburkholderia sp. EG287A]|uniref:hypothetical protein n=1 Tax=Paraburkholderia sp. EG287A TaxID=3237012 RepID=UPI0034D35FF7